MKLGVIVTVTTIVRIEVVTSPLLSAVARTELQGGFIRFHACAILPIS